MRDNSSTTNSTEEEGALIPEENGFTKTLGKHVTSSFFAVAVSRLFALLLLKALAVLLAKSDYGLYSLWVSFASLLAIFSTSMFSNTLWRFFQSTNFKQKKRKSRLLSTAVIGSLGLATIGSALLFIPYAIDGYAIIEDPVYLSSLVVTIFLAFAYILKEIVLVVSGTEQNSREILLFNSLYSAGAFVVAIILALAFRDFRAIMIGSFLGLIIPVSATFYYKLKHYGHSRPSQFMLKKCFSYGGPLMIVTTVTISCTFVVSYFVGVHVGFAEVATLAVALTIAGIVGFVVGPPLTAYNVFLINSYESGCLERSNRVTTRIIEMYISFATVVFVLASSAAPIVITLIATEAYLDAIPLLPFTIGATLLIPFSRIWQYRLLLKEETHLVGGAYFLSLIVLAVSCIVLVPLYGVEGAAVALILHSLTVFIIIVPRGQMSLGFTLQKSFFVKWFLSLIALVMTRDVLSLLGMIPLMSGVVAVCVFLSVMLVTRAHRIADIKQMMDLLLPLHRSKQKTTQL